MLQTTVNPRSVLTRATVAPIQRWTLEQIIYKRRLKPGESVLGVASDKLPCLLDLHDPERTGALLFIGKRYSTIDILKSMAYSMLIGSPQSGVIVMTSQPQAWRPFGRMVIYGDDTPVAWVASLIKSRDADWREVLLLVDNPALIGDWDAFNSVCQNGPQAWVWTAMASESMAEVNTPEVFRSRIPEVADGEFSMRDGDKRIHFSPLLF